MNVATQAKLWYWQRISAMLLALFVLVHLVTLVYAVRGGLTGAEILGRTRGSWIAALFYGGFVLTAAVHAPIGLARVAEEWLGLNSRTSGRRSDTVRRPPRRQRDARGLRSGGVMSDPGVIPAEAGIQCLFVAKTLGPRLRGDDKSQPSVVLGVRAASRVRHRPRCVPAAALLGAGTGAAGRGRRSTASCASRTRRWSRSANGAWSCCSRRI